MRKTKEEKKLNERILSDGTTVYTIKGNKSWKCNDCKNFWIIKLKKEPIPTICPKCKSNNIISKDKIIKAKFPNGKKITPKHSHFAIDIYAKRHADKQTTKIVFNAIKSLFDKIPSSEKLRDMPIDKKLNFASEVLSEMSNTDKNKVKKLPGYNIEYIINCLDLILQQEATNYSPNDISPKTGKPYEGKKYTFGLLEDVFLKDIHPVEAMLNKGLRI